MAGRAKKKKLSSKDRNKEDEWCHRRMVGGEDRANNIGVVRGRV